MRLIAALTVISALSITAGAATAIDWSLYHKTDEILSFFKRAAASNPAVVRYDELRDPDTRFKLPVATISNLSSSIAEEKQTIFLVAGEHARELITSEIALWFGHLLTGGRAEELQDWAALQPIQATAWKSGWTQGTLRDWASHILDRVTFKIFPVQNIAGRKAVEGGTVCLRKTISGVDLNRNWPFSWEMGDAGTDEFGGPKPLSEPESRIVRMVAESTQPSAYVNLHSGEWAMYVPWDSKKVDATHLPADTGELLDRMNVYCACMKGPAGKVAGYLAKGSSMDWMYAVQHVPYPLTFEVYGPKGLGKLSQGGHPRSRMLQAADGQGQAAGCFETFNPATRELYEATVAEWLGILLVLADHVALHPRASGTKIGEHRQLPVSPSVLHKVLRLGNLTTTDASDRLDLEPRRSWPKSGFKAESSDLIQTAILVAYIVFAGLLAGMLVAGWRRMTQQTGRRSMSGHRRVSRKELV